MASPLRSASPTIPPAGAIAATCLGKGMRPAARVAGTGSEGTVASSAGSGRSQLMHLKPVGTSGLLLSMLCGLFSSEDAVVAAAWKLC